MLLKAILAIETIEESQSNLDRQTEHLKRSFFFKNRPIHFHINSTRVIKPVKRKKMRFPGYPWMERQPPPLALRK